MVVSEMTQEELQQLIERSVWKVLAQIIQDPDYELEFRDTVVQRVKVSEDLSRGDLISSEDLALELDLEL